MISMFTPFDLNSLKKDWRYLNFSRLTLIVEMKISDDVVIWWTKIVNENMNCARKIQNWMNDLISDCIWVKLLYSWCKMNKLEDRTRDIQYKTQVTTPAQQFTTSTRWQRDKLSQTFFLKYNDVFDWLRSNILLSNFKFTDLRLRE